MTLDTMKTELRDNQKLSDSFKDKIEVVKDAEGDSEFRHPDGFTTKVLCKGADQIGSIRGVKFGAYRPDLFLIDDVEDDELVRNPQRRTELQALYDEALVPAGERGKCQFIIIGTVLHDDSQLAKMVLHENAYTQYHKIFLEGHLDPDGPNEASIWPEKWTIDWLHWMRQHQPTVYAKEIQNNPVAGLLGVFQRENFRYWKLQGDHEGDQQYVLYGPRGEVVTLGYLLNCKAAIACDLAWSDKRQADFCVIMPGLLTPQADLLVWPYFAEKGVRPDRLEEILFTLDLKLKALTRGAVPIGFEKAMLEKVVGWMLKQAMRKRNHPLLLKDLKWDTDQTSRIELRLSDRYTNKMIYHQTGMGELEHQLLRFPSGSHQDLPDALQGLVQLLNTPKKLQEQQLPKDQFMMMRQLTIDAKKPKGGGLFKLNHPHQLKKRLPVIPAQKAWLTPSIKHN